MKLSISVNLKNVCGVCRLFVTTSFCSVDTNPLCGSKGNHARTRKKLPEKQTAFCTFSANRTLPSFSFSKVR